MIDTNVKLPQPEVGYGAVYGRDNAGQVKRYYVFAALTLVWLVALAGWIISGVNPSLITDYFTETLMGFSIFVTVLLGIVGLLGGADALLSHNDTIYENDVYRNRAHYARTIFREWFMETYGVKINPEQAHSLMDGSDARVLRDGEYLRVMFDYSGRNFSSLAQIGRSPNSYYVDTKNWTLPDVDSIEFNLMILEDPQRPRQRAWV